MMKVSFSYFKLYVLIPKQIVEIITFHLLYGEHCNVLFRTPNWPCGWYTLYFFRLSYRVYLFFIFVQNPRIQYYKNSAQDLYVLTMQNVYTKKILDY